MDRREFLAALGDGGGSAGSHPRTISVVAERDPAAFRAAFVAAVARGGQVALANPDWGSVERAEFERLLSRRATDLSAERGWLLIPTGGSTGGVKLARHDQQTLVAAVRAYAEFFDEPVIRAVGVLPLHHVGGLMAWLRCRLTGGDYLDASWRAWSEGRLVERLPDEPTVSLVPTQLRRLLAEPEGALWLRHFKRVLLGGAALGDDLIGAAEGAGIAVVPSYGMTETAAMIAAQPAGGDGGLVLFPHVTASVGEDGRLQLVGDSLFRGYWPERREPGPWLSADRAELTSTGGLRILGRADAIIVTGGEKVDAGEVETLLQELFGDERVAVVGMADDRWGQRVVAVVAAELAPRCAEVTAALADRLAPFKRPKAYVSIPSWPVNALGKVQRTVLVEAIAKAAPERQP